MHLKFPFMSFNKILRINKFDALNLHINDYSIPILTSVGLSTFRKKKPVLQKTWNIGQNEEFMVFHSGTFKKKYFKMKINAFYQRNCISCEFTRLKSIFYFEVFFC